MATYGELVKKIEDLKKQADQARRTELKDVIAEIRQKVTQFGLTAQDLFGGKPRRARRKKVGKVKAKYRDSATGQTWTGRGRPPRWLAEAEKAGKSRDSFLI